MVRIMVNRKRPSKEKVLLASHFSDSHSETLYKPGSPAALTRPLSKHLLSTNGTRQKWGRASKLYPIQPMLSN